MIRYVLVCVLSFGCLLNEAVAEEPVQVILDTDMAGDCDDAGALAVLNELADRGEARILAIITNRRDEAGVSAAACDVINTFYGRGDTPIATDKDGAKFAWNKPNPYTRNLADSFPHDCPPDKDCPDALGLYRKTLAAAEDCSVVVCSVGALSNMEDLLNSQGDTHSPHSGEELIRAKVKRTVIMGGHFPRFTKPETNLRLDPAASVCVTHRWPGEILWQGYEVGAALYAEHRYKPAMPTIRSGERSSYVRIWGNRRLNRASRHTIKLPCCWPFEASTTNNGSSVRPEESSSTPTATASGWPIAANNIATFRSTAIHKD